MVTNWLQTLQLVYGRIKIQFGVSDSKYSVGAPKTQPSGPSMVCSLQENRKAQQDDSSEQREETAFDSPVRENFESGWHINSSVSGLPSYSFSIDIVVSKELSVMSVSAPQTEAGCKSFWSLYIKCTVLCKYTKSYPEILGSETCRKCMQTRFAKLLSSKKDMVLCLADHHIKGQGYRFILMWGSYSLTFLEGGD